MVVVWGKMGGGIPTAYKRRTGGIVLSLRNAAHLTWPEPNGGGASFYCETTCRARTPRFVLARLFRTMFGQGTVSVLCCAVLMGAWRCTDDWGIIIKLHV
jgi:hypothetical protein